MRTTISIDDHILHAAKQRALERQTTLGGVIEDALRLALDPRVQEHAATTSTLPVSARSGGTRPGIDITRGRSTARSDGRGLILLDVNVLVDAFRGDQPRHAAVREWLEGRLDGGAIIGVPELALSGFLRVITHPRVFNEPNDVEDGLTFAERLLGLPHVLAVRPGDRHWAIFARLCRVTRAVGNAIPDAYLAAVTIECGGELASGDRGFSRFPDLRWYDPVAPD